MNDFNVTKIKHIIFDLGSVLLNINPLLSLDAFAKLGNISTETLKSRLKNEVIFEKYDTGEYSDEVFRLELCRILGTTLENKSVDEAWNALLLDFPSERMHMVLDLSKNYNVFLLSNTNSIHYKSYSDTFRKKFGLQFSSLFNEEFLSFRMGMRKPDVAIYLKVLEMGRFQAAECLFIDDLLTNAEAAKSVGITTVHLAEGTRVTDLFEAGKIVESLKIL